MQTPKTRNSCNSEAALKVSPRGRVLSSEIISPKVSPRTVSSSSNVPLKLSPRVVHQLKTTSQDSDSSSSCSNRKSSRTHKDGCLKKVSEVKKKGSSNRVVYVLEAQIAQLQNELKKVNDQLDSSESQREKAVQDAEESNNQLLVMSSKVESFKQLITKEAIVDVLELDNSKKQQSVDSALLESAVNEIKELKLQLEFVADSEVAHTKQTELACKELNSLKEALADSLVLVEKMDIQLKDSKESESRAKDLMGETLFQLQTAKRTVETLRSDGIKTMEAYETMVSELEQSKAQVNSLDALIHELKSRKSGELCDLIEPEVTPLKSEINQLRSALEALEIKNRMEKTQSELQIKSAFEKMEVIKSSSTAKETEFETETQLARLEIEELKANLIDKETELQCIREENQEIRKKLEENQESKFDVEDLKTKLPNILEENETLKMKIKELEPAKAAEKEALMKLGFATEEVEKNNQRLARVSEQLEAAQTTNSEIETELRRLKVQSEQWRKAAETAAAIISSETNSKFMDRAVSMDNKYSPRSRSILLASPYSEEGDDDMTKKKSPNVLKKLGVMWKKKTHNK